MYVAILLMHSSEDPIPGVGYKAASAGEAKERCLDDYAALNSATRDEIKADLEEGNLEIIVVKVV